MKDSKHYYFALDIIRIIACIAVLFYHLNFLKGGYLAVCTFLVLSGYLAVLSASKQEKFSFKKYYLNRFKKIYLPLLFVVLITIFIVQLIPDNLWLNLKPETTSVLLGYNNFWQLKANLDYFARHVSSPFMHLWYIAILLQFEIIFPFIYLVMKKIGDKLNKFIPCILFGIIFIIGAGYFYYSYMTKDLMTTYYSTFTRIFSLFLGLAVGFIHLYFKPLTLWKKDQSLPLKIVYILYLMIIICSYFFVPSTSKLMPVAMIITCLITWRLIDYSSMLEGPKISFIENIVKSLANVSYEVYLWQYPFIYIVACYSSNQIIDTLLIIVITIIFSYILHFALSNKNQKYKVMQIIALFLLSFGATLGCYNYIISKDHTKEMNDLEQQLANNSKILEEKQKLYAEQMQKEREEFTVSLDNLDFSEEELKLKVSNLNVVGIGDSVMLGAIDNLYEEFPNGYFDAKISRTAWVVNDILVDLNNRHILGEPIILNLGANGDCPEECKERIIATVKNRDIYWLNVTNDNEVHFNAKLKALAAKHSNIHIIDWQGISKNHKEYFVADGIHLTDIGKKVYTQAIYDAIYDTYYQKYQQQKEELIKEYEAKVKNKISFIGNDLLLNAYDNIKEDYPEALFEINQDFNISQLEQLLTTKIEDNTLTYQVVFILDDKANIAISDWQKIIDMLKDTHIYIVTLNETIKQELSKISTDKLTILYLPNNSSNVMADRIHLTNQGNEELRNLLKNNLL